MNQLFLKIRAKILFFIVLGLCLCNNAFSKVSNNSDKFDQVCEKSNAYLLYSYTDVVYSKVWGRYDKQVSVQQKLVVNNKLGVENHAFFNLSKKICDNLKILDVRTLKADGTVVRLDSSMVFDHQNNEELDVIRYPIPGVEPGDTIYTKYVYVERRRVNNLMDYVNLYDYVPSYKTEYSISIKPDLNMRYKAYNNFPEPQVLTNDTLVYCLFKMEEVTSVEENKYNCIPCELPYVYYSIEEEKNKLRTWKDVYNQEFNIVTQPILLDYQNSSYYSRWKKRIIGEAKDSSKYIQLKLLYNEILHNFQIIPSSPEEIFKSSGYFLKEHHFDPISIRRLYRQLLEDLGINYWAVFARSKRSGNIDPYYIRRGEYDHIFFAYENEQGTINLLYPHTESFKYQINEIPTSLYSTQAVIVQPVLTDKVKRKDRFINYDLELAEVDSVDMNVINLPGMNAIQNYLKQVYYCDVDIIRKKATFESSFSVSGGLSTDVRSFYSMINKNEEVGEFYDALAEFEGDKFALEIDSVSSFDLNENRPFVFNFRAEGKLSKALTFTNDSIVSLTLDKIVQHNEVESEADSTILNYYLDYGYNDFFMLVLKFPCNIELLGDLNNSKVLKNSFGEYMFKVNKVGTNQLIIQSNYKILKDIVLKEDYLQIKKINDVVDKAKNVRLLIKLKDS